MNVFIYFHLTIICIIVNVTINMTIVSPKTVLDRTPAWNREFAPRFF